MRKGISPMYSVKVYIRKAYDSVEQRFVKIVLLVFGLPSMYVDLIMECVCTLNYSLLIYRGPSFQAKRGLEKGPHVSLPFVLIMKYMNRSLKRLQSIPYFNYHPKCENLGLVNILFVDDFLMCVYHINNLSNSCLSVLSTFQQYLA